MGIQQSLNQIALDMLPKTRKALDESDMRNYLIDPIMRSICNSHIPIAEMTESQLKKFDSKLAYGVIHDQDDNC